MSTAMLNLSEIETFFEQGYVYQDGTREAQLFEWCEQLLEEVWRLREEVKGWHELAACRRELQRLSLETIRIIREARDE